MRFYIVGFLWCLFWWALSFVFGVGVVYLSGTGTGFLGTLMFPLDYVVPLCLGITAAFLSAGWQDASRKEPVAFSKFKYK